MAKLKKRKRKKKGMPSPLPRPRVRASKPKYTELIYAIEVAIYEMSVADEDLRDRDVIAALRELSSMVRKGVDQEPLEIVEVGEGRSIAPYLYQRVNEFLEENPDYDTYEVVGTIQELIKSVKTRREMHGGPRGYLYFLDGFMRDLGVSVRIIDPDGNFPPDD